MQKHWLKQVTVIVCNNIYGNIQTLIVWCDMVMRNILPFFPPTPCHFKMCAGITFVFTGKCSAQDATLNCAY